MQPGRYARHFTGVGVDKAKLFFEEGWPRELMQRLSAALPPYNDTACATELRRVDMPSDAAGTAPPVLLPAARSNGAAAGCRRRCPQNNSVTTFLV